MCAGMGNGLEKCARIISLKGCCGELVFGTIPLSVRIANIAATGTCWHPCTAVARRHLLAMVCEMLCMSRSKN
jgi:hypothetical protein